MSSLNLPRSGITHGDVFYNRKKAHYCPRYASNVNNGERAGVRTADAEIAFYADGDVYSVNINEKLAFIAAAIPRREFVQSDVRIGIWEGKWNNTAGSLLEYFSLMQYFLVYLGEESMKGVGVNPSYSSYSRSNKDYTEE